MRGKFLRKKLCRNIFLQATQQEQYVSYTCKNCVNQASKITCNHIRGNKVFITKIFSRVKMKVYFTFFTHVYFPVETVDGRPFAPLKIYFRYLVYFWYSVHFRNLVHLPYPHQLIRIL